MLAARRISRSQAGEPQRATELIGTRDGVAAARDASRARLVHPRRRCDPGTAMRLRRVLRALPSPRREQIRRCSRSVLARIVPRTPSPSVSSGSQRRRRWAVTALETARRQARRRSVSPLYALAWARSLRQGAADSRHLPSVRGHLRFRLPRSPRRPQRIAGQRLRSGVARSARRGRSSSSCSRSADESGGVLFLRA